MHVKHRLLLLTLLSSAALTTVWAGEITYNFDTDPTGVINQVGSDPDIPRWQSKGGNPESGGFLAVTYSDDYFNTGILFPDLDPGKVVTSFTFDCDLRVGNPSSDRAADGFSISFARAGDPVLEHWKDEDPLRGFRGDSLSGGCPSCENAALPETGTMTGISISFDTWSGNTLPDGSDTEGILVVVDNKTVKRQAMPKRSGACDDNTSLQTGLKDAEYWTGGGDATVPDAWKTLCWQPLHVQLDPDGKLTVSWKGRTILDHYQTSYFPTAGQLVFAGRTGGSTEQTHVDNIHLVTTAIVGEAVAPTVPTNLKATAGSRSIVLEWTPSQEQPDPTQRVAYQIEKDGTVSPSLVTDPKYVDTIDIKPGATHTYRVRAVDLNQNKSDWASVTATAVQEVPGGTWILASVYSTNSSDGTGFSGATKDDLLAVLADPKYPTKPDAQTGYLPSLMVGTPPTFGVNTLGDNLLIRFAGTITPPETGQYRFFVASDDASLFYLNTSGSAIPDANTATPIAQETDCCDAFVEPGTNNDDGETSATSEAVSLTAGTEYGYLFLVKEGTGGDGGAVAWRKEGDTTPAGSLQAISGVYLKPTFGDPGGASVTISKDLADLATPANEKVTFTAGVNFTSPWTTTPITQWYKNGTPILGATGTNYTIPRVTAADSGAKYKFYASVPGAEVFSKEMTLTVTADNKAPSLVSAKGFFTLTETVVEFSEEVGASAESAANYKFDQGITVSAVKRIDPYKVALTHTKMAEGTTYQLTVNGVQDSATPANTIAADSKINVRSNVFKSGVVLHQLWDNITAGNLAGVTNDTRFPYAPTTVTQEPAFEYGPDGSNESGSNYGNRLIAWFTPPSTGNYVFFVNSDDASNLYLSPDDSPANKKLIAQETGWSDQRQWVAVGGGTSVAEDKRSDMFAGSEWTGGGSSIRLEAGKKYYIEAVHVEGGGGDNVAATFIKQGDPDPVAGDAPKLTGTLVGAYVEDTGGGNGNGDAVFTSVKLAGGNLEIAWSGGTLESADAITGPWTAVANATSPASVPVTGSAKFYRVR